MLASRQLLSELLPLLFLCSLTLDLPAQIATQPPAIEGSSVVTFSFDEHQTILPVKIVSVMLGDQEIPLNTPIPVSGMWMSNIRVIVENISSKKIVCGEAYFFFPELLGLSEIGDDGVRRTPVQVLGIGLGRLPKHALMQSDGTVRKFKSPLAPIHIAQGSRMEFATKSYATTDALQVQYYRLVRRISKVDISMAPFYFSDGSKWMAGKFFLPVARPELWRETSPAGFLAETPLVKR